MNISTARRAQRAVAVIALVFLFLFAPVAQSAFLGSSDGTTLTLVQTTDDGAVVIDDNGAGNIIRATDGSGTTDFVATTNLVVDMLAGTGNQLDIDLDSALAGDLTLNLQDGARNVNMVGSNNGIGGSFMVIAGADVQTLEIAVNAGLSVGADLMFDLGSGQDSVDEDNNNIGVTGNFTFINVNFFENGGTATIGGNVLVDTTGEVEDMLFDDDATLTITGNLTINGGSGRDEVTMNGVAGGTSIGGFANVNVGDNTTGGVQFIFFNLPNSSVGGALTVTSTSAVNLDSFSMHPAATVGGEILVNLGDGTNDANFSGIYSGSAGSYLGGSGVDNVSMSAVAAGMDFEVYLGDSYDSFVLDAGTVLNSLYLDFGFCEARSTSEQGANFTDGFNGDYPFEVAIDNFYCTVPPIPSLSFGGIALLAGLLALVGLRYRRRDLLA